MNMQPLGNRLMIRRDEPETVSSGGIILPTESRDSPQVGTVVSVGSGQSWEHHFTDGDRVLFGKYAGSSITVDGNNLLVISEDDVIAVITD